jgi:hypothetical protein
MGFAGAYAGESVAEEFAKLEKVEDPVAKDLVGEAAIDHPVHYNNGAIECIDYIEDQRLGYKAGAAVKYIARYRFKGKPVEDLKKAAWYLLRLAQKIEDGGDLNG